jgi:hypothetical protein
LHFKGAFIDAIIHDAGKTLLALVEKRRRSEVRVTRVDGGTARQQGVCKGWAAVVL